MNSTKLTLWDHAKIVAYALRRTSTDYCGPLIIGYGVGKGSTAWALVGAAVFLVGFVLGQRESAADLKSRAADLNLVGKAIDYTRAKVIHEDQAMAIKAEIELHQAVLEASEARAKA